jgi:hypothetical protein
LIGGGLGSDDCGGSGTVMKRGDSGGTARAWAAGVVLKARHGDVVGVLVVAVVEMRHEERAAWRPHIDGRESGEAIVVVVGEEKGAILPASRIGVRARMVRSRGRDPGSGAGGVVNRES